MKYGYARLPLPRPPKVKRILFQYAGYGDKTRIVSWFQGHPRGLVTCLEAKLPEAALVLRYSGIDTFGMIAALSGVGKATRSTFLYSV